MLCNPISSFPAKVDEQTFFQDVNLDNLSIMNHYDQLIAQGKYNEANTYINQQSGIYGYFADFFNMIENRIYKLQSYLFSGISYTCDELAQFTCDELSEFTCDQLGSALKKEKYNPFVSTYDPEQEPDVITGDTIWI